ncbi:spike base protein, RCAP_Rcc01079 family [Paraburkholderia sp. MM5477-R1]|uniref:spike base protein, RCAP_Rcc01079 family n=1 Tax=Paraburkholderia sp. MM5477-R1 TaxID=2991062 RepID=UPI003D1C0586
MDDMRKAVDRYPHSGTGLDSLLDLWVVIPDDDNDMPFVSRAVCVTVAGDFHVITARGSEIVVPLDVGWHPLRLRRVYASGTTGECIAGD